MNCWDALLDRWSAPRPALPGKASKSLALPGFHQLGIAAVFAGHLQKLAANVGIADLAGQTLRLIGLKSIMLGLGHQSTSILSQNPGCKGSVTLKSQFRAFPLERRSL